LRDEIEHAPPVPVTALYSRDDGIIDWRCCLQEESSICCNIEVSGAHSSMGFNPEAQTTIAHALASAGHPDGDLRQKDFCTPPMQSAIRDPL
jgi:hypothetical protein